jgi:hypothetical protein
MWYQSEVMISNFISVIYLIFQLNISRVGPFSLKKCLGPHVRDNVVQKKADTTIPITTLSDQESNTTFPDGTTWCTCGS